MFRGCLWPHGAGEESFIHNGFSHKAIGESVQSVPWLSYIPVPGLQAVAVYLAPEDPLTRYHAWQGGTLVALLYAFLVLVGLLARASDAAAFLATMGLFSGFGLLAGVAGLVYGAVSAARGRYGRVRPIWDLIAALKT